MDAAIEMRDLSVRFKSGFSSVDALRGLSLTVPQGHVVGFLGPNGAGKTTAIHVLLGFVRAVSGGAKVLGRDVREAIARERIGYLPEHPNTYPFLTGRELLHFTGRMFRMRGRQLRDRASELLHTVKLGGAADRRTATYSRGMLQRVCLAQAMLNDPDLLILDEPTGGLDPAGRMDVRAIIADLRARGKTVFFSSHELSEVELVCDRVVILAAGRLVAEGPAAQLAGRDESLERYFLRVTAA